MSSPRRDLPGWSTQATGPTSSTPPMLAHPLQDPPREGAPDGLFTIVRDPRGPLAGVCEGIARRFQVDPLLVRVAFALLALSMGVGLALYTMLALFMPTADGERLAYRWMPGTRSWNSSLIWWVTVGLCIAGIPVFGSVSPHGPLPAIVLAVVWLYSRRWQRRQRSRRLDRHWTGTTELDAASRAWQARLHEVYEHTNPAPTPAPPTVGRPAPVYHSSAAPSTVPFQPSHTSLPGSASAPAPRPAARRDGPSWAATGVMILMLTTATILTTIWAPNSLTLQAGVLLAVVAGCLVVGAFWRRPRLAVPIGLVLALLMGGSIVFPNLSPEGPSGTQVYSASRPIPDDLTITMRQTTLDLGGLPLDSDRTIRVNVTASEVRIPLPDNAIVEYTLHAGSLVTPSGETTAESGTYRSLRRPGEPVLTLQVTVTAAEVTLQ
ncbi:PspC domain-containing protein [Aestuariimicrobium sp. p3-SID1156]|uniref:PspC domain-containing protein n=1 Tax=Aestuariimicrobium sp. p3-SID1156 TaxID=2916038 RepID=UPI00223BAA14|nr:PspC domain-containing protein [Aestuariimicrobium sp. p3-SID1156]MCT1460270.1 PspC domain-containing protein [Aestuariimicrobium sp. p3-SID1156]